MSCGRIRDLLSAYIDEQLGPDQRRLVDDHLAACPDCARELALLRRTIKLVAEMPEEELPADFHASLRAGLAEAAGDPAAKDAAPPPPLAPRSLRERLGGAWRRPAWRGVLAATAATVLVFAAIQHTLPDWNGNIWTLLRASRVEMADGGEDTSGGTAVKLHAGDQPDLGGKERAGDAPAGVMADPRRLVPEGSLAAALAEAQIAHSATLYVGVKSFLEADRQVTPIVESAGGYIQQSSVNLAAEVRSGHYNIRVPQPRFSVTLVELEELGTTNRKELVTRDLTGQIIDLEARLANLRRQELRLAELLGRAGNLDEVLRVENELNRVRYEVETNQAQLAYQQNQVAMSTIALNLAEPGPDAPPQIPGADLWDRVWRAFGASWRGIGQFIEGLVVFVASLAPLLLLLYGGWWGFNRYRKNRARRPSRAAADQ